jgi:hypothetical protein
MAEGSQSAPETISAPTTPVKREGVKIEADCKDTEFEAGGCDLSNAKEREVDMGLQFSNNIFSTKNEEKVEVEIERDSEKKEFTPSPREIPGPPTIVTRTPILTVPTLPFMSLQARSPGHGHGVHRITQDNMDTTVNQKSTREPDPAVSKTGAVSATIPLSANVPKGSVPWQPHANSQATPPRGHTAHLISSLHPQHSLNIPNPLAGAMGSNLSKDQEKGMKEGEVSGGSSKKARHKKKKEKSDRERERDGKSRSSESGGRDGGKGIFSGSGTNYSGGKGKEREERRNSKGGLGESTSGSRRDSDSGGGNSGENRDDPQSPAYSDISDANDSGPESDIPSSIKELPPKVIPVVPDLKKENVGIAPSQNISSFYSPFYSPHSLESPFTSPNPNGGPGGQAKHDRPSAALPANAGDEPSAEKVRPKQAPPMSQHLQGHIDERRSPKMDYHPKYLPPQHQQHYYPYPYGNYHYDQPPYGLMPEHYNPHRGMMEEKERETSEEQRGRLNSKGRSSTDSSNKDESGGLSSAVVKQESHSERERGSKNPRLHSNSLTEDKAPDPKSDFNSEYVESRRHGGSHFIPTSTKHSKESKRDREERHSHSGKDNEGREAGKGRSSQEHSGRQKNADSANSGERDVKNEGAKPTMETQGPPPAPTERPYAYIPAGYPFGIPFDPTHPLYRQCMVPQYPVPGSAYMHPGGIPRFSQPPGPGSTPLPEDLSRPNANVPGASKALDLLQHHAAQYYASHKIHELQERALKSPSPQIGGGPNSGTGISGPSSLSSTPSSPSGLSAHGRTSGGPAVSGAERKSSDLSKDTKPPAPLSTPVSGAESSRSPPIHHVHTHMHSHTHIGYPIIPTVPPQYSPHYGGKFLAFEHYSS